MVNQRKKRIIDGIDREILRNLHKKESMTGNQLAKKINFTASAITPRLRNLESKGIIKTHQIGKTRIFERTFKGKKRKIKVPRSIHWSLDLKSP